MGTPYCEVIGYGIEYGGASDINLVKATTMYTESMRT